MLPYFSTLLLLFIFFFFLLLWYSLYPPSAFVCDVININGCIELFPRSDFKLTTVYRKLSPIVYFVSSSLLSYVWVFFFLFYFPCFLIFGFRGINLGQAISYFCFNQVESCTCILIQVYKYSLMNIVNEMSSQVEVRNIFLARRTCHICGTESWHANNLDI